MKIKQTKDQVVELSIVIPVFNALKFIHDTLNFLKTISENLYTELIIVNDGSTDDSDALIKQFIKVNSDFKYHHIFRENKGVSASRNEGLAMATGKFITFIDADDLVPPLSLLMKVMHLEMYPQYAGVTSDAKSFNVAFGDNPEVLQGLFRLDDLLDSNPGFNTCPSGYVWRRSILEAAKIDFATDLQSSADKFFLLQIMQSAEIGFIPEAAFYYRKHAGSMSHKITEHLISDKLLYSKKVSEILSPTHHMNIFQARNYYAVGGMYFKLGMKRRAFKYLWKSLLLSPMTVLKIRMR